MRTGKTMCEKPEVVRPSGLESQTEEAEIERLVQDLNALEEGERTAGTLMAYGRSAIPALRRFLLEGRPSVVYQPRRWAVEALAGIGARDVLIEYLKHKRLLADPAVRFGEEPVENAAARALARWKDDETFEMISAGLLPRRLSEHSAPGQSLRWSRRSDATPLRGGGAACKRAQARQRLGTALRDGIDRRCLAASAGVGW
jgi:hypothetical protein